ncbi:MAG: DUF371 domain-containing protein [Hadesarchaea archaeon]|nr:DUF371 domain-containing protein [Hadesarchaea archaeon]
MTKNTLETILARGHSNITAQHSTTLMITKDMDIGIEADCIVGVNSEKAVSDLNKETKLAIRSGKKIEVKIEINEISEVIQGRGHEDLDLVDSNDLVIRKSDYICGRTFMINSDKAAKDLSEKLVKQLKNPEAKLKLSISVIE